MQLVRAVAHYAPPPTVASFKRSSTPCDNVGSDVIGAIIASIPACVDVCGVVSRFLLRKSSTIAPPASIISAPAPQALATVLEVLCSWFCLILAITGSSVCGDGTTSGGDNGCRGDDGGNSGGVNGGNSGGVT